jgi:hypothetical protein
VAGEFLSAAPYGGQSQEVQKNGSKTVHFGTFLLKTRSFLQKKHKKAQKNAHFYPHF